MLGTVQLVWQRLQSRLHGTLLNSLIVMGGYLLSRITGLLRDIAIAYQFGTSASLGAYYAAFRITDLLYMVVIGGALGSSFIPVFIQTWDRAGERRAWQLASAVMNWALLVLALASALLWLLAPWLTAQFYSGPDVSAQQLALTSDLTRLFLLSPLLLGLGGLAMAVLNAHNRFTLPALAPATYNLGIIGGALLLAPLLGIWGLAWGVVLGAAIYLLLQLPGLWRLGMALTLTLGRGFDMALRRDLGSIAVQMAPRVIGQAASQISLLVTAALTTSLALGLQRLAGLNYAYQLMLLPYGIFSLSLSTVAFPQLARLFAAGEHDELCERVRRTLRMILFLTLPAAVALIVLAVPLVRVLYQWGGAFDQTSLLYTTVPLLAYATALPAFAASEILIRSFYAMQKTWIPVLIGLLQVGLNLALGTLALSMGGGVGMLALAFSIANNVEALLLVVLLGRQMPGIWRDGPTWRSIGAAALASGLLALLLVVVRQVSLPLLPVLAAEQPYFWQHDLLPLLLWLALVGAAGAGLYGLLAGLAGSHEARLAWARLRGRG